MNKKIFISIISDKNAKASYYIQKSRSSFHWIIFDSVSIWSIHKRQSSSHNMSEKTRNRLKRFAMLNNLLDGKKTLREQYSFVSDRSTIYTEWVCQIFESLYRRKFQNSSW